MSSKYVAAVPCWNKELNLVVSLFFFKNSNEQKYKCNKIKNMKHAFSEVYYNECKCTFDKYLFGYWLTSFPMMT